MKCISAIGWIVAGLWMTGRLQAQELLPCPPCDLGHWRVPAGNYSGITPLGGGRYAVVSDKMDQEGFFIFRVVQDPSTGQVTAVINEGFRGVPSGLQGGRGWPLRLTILWSG
ncbi:MAG: hypothetical protein LUC45_04165 [Paraprevotella sp.]|nr:hypothetical protein [Paraprevotella sp.]